jgi:lipopolysaccharide transport system permease protein
VRASGTEADSPFAHDHVTVIEPRRGWRALDLREVWAYRELLWVLAARDVRVRYRQTILGAGWAIARPLLTMVVFSQVFGRFAGMPSEGFPYPVFVYAGLLPWTFFATAVTTAGSSLVGSAHLIGKIYFPRLLIPLSSIGAALVDLAVSTAVLLVLIAYYGLPFTTDLLATPLLVVLLACTAVGVGVLVAALSATYRDLHQLLPFLVQIWMFLSPVIYPVELFPERWRWALFLNPVTGLIEGFRSAFLGKPFEPRLLLVSVVAAAVTGAVALVVFQRVERRLADVL